MVLFYLLLACTTKYRDLVTLVTTYRDLVTLVTTYRDLVTLVTTVYRAMVTTSHIVVLSICW